MFRHISFSHAKCKVKRPVPQSEDLNRSRISTGTQRILDCCSAACPVRSWKRQ